MTKAWNEWKKEYVLGHRRKRKVMTPIIEETEIDENTNIEKQRNGGRILGR